MMELYSKYFFVGLLLSISLVQNVLSQNLKTYSQSNSVSWRGSSSFKEFWKRENDEELFEKLFKKLTNENDAFKKLQNSDILAAIANLDFKISETSDKLNAIVTFRIVLNTSAEIQGTGIRNVDTITKASASANSEGGSRNSRPSKFDEAVLTRHNTYRKKHKVPALTYSKKISEVSQDWANKLADKDEFYHRPHNKYGENLYTIWNSNPKYQVTANEPVDAWYSEVKNYIYTKSGNISVVGHFTQLVWKNSKELGIGVAKSKTNRYYVVCNYSPPGNVIGQFAENVLRPSKS